MGGSLGYQASIETQSVKVETRAMAITPCCLLQYVGEPFKKVHTQMQAHVNSLELQEWGFRKSLFFMFSGVILIIPTE